VRRYFNRLRDLAFSSTAKDTFIVFIGNLGSAFWGFLFTLFVARSLSVSDFGVFSAVLNLVNILSSLADIGISTGSVNFVSEYLGKNDEEKANEYVKASFITRLLIVMAISIVMLAFSPIVPHKLLATTNSRMGLWVAVIPIFWFPDYFFPFILQARKKFLHSVIYDNSFYFGRLFFALIFYIIGALTIDKAFLAFGVGFLVTVILTFVFVRIDFYHTKPARNEYQNLLKFSGWIGVNRIISSISGKLDIQMLAVMAGAFATGLYSIPSRLASFIIVLSSSFSAVLAPRMAGFGDKGKEKVYLVKSTLALFPITAGIIFWIIAAKPFILLLFGEKYLPSVPVFQALTASMIPFLFTVPSVTAIIYSMKKTVFIGLFSFFQLAAIFILNYILIPRYGPFGPTITFGITNTILAIYTWVIVIKHYWIKNG
jgi:O-antigen/teichoic acid export membrane protein